MLFEVQRKTSSNFTNSLKKIQGMALKVNLFVSRHEFALDIQK